MSSFNTLGLSESLLSAIESMGFSSPTEIQQQSIPLILEGKDVLGESATGSGKTLAFGCGVVHQCQPKGGVQAVILTPTRELAEQVKDVLVKVARPAKLKVAAVYGGVAMGPQIEKLKRCEIVVATPGRFCDHMERGTIYLNDINVVVLDEADRMLDMGFINDIEFILDECRSRKQTLFFSATFSPQIKKLSHKFMNSPELVAATKQVDPSKLEQVYFDIRRNEKFSLLVHLLLNEEAHRILVFCNTRHSVDSVVKNLKDNGIAAAGLHGGFTQNKRNEALEKFSAEEYDVLVCTDVAARGIHIDHVSHVFNFEIPADPTDYVHRIGRTARAGKEGMVFNIIAEMDHENFSRVIREHRDMKIVREQPPEFKSISFSRSQGRPQGRPQGGGFRGRSNGGSSRGGPSRGGNRGPSRGSSGNRPSGNRSSSQRRPARPGSRPPQRRNSSSPRRSDR